MVFFHFSVTATMSFWPFGRSVCELANIVGIVDATGMTQNHSLLEELDDKTKTLDKKRATEAGVLGSIDRSSALAQKEMILM